MNNQKLVRTVILALALLGAFAVSGGALPTSAAPPAAAAQAFDTPQQAADAIVKAASDGDVAALEKILGPGSKNVVASGDPVEDKNNLEKFAGKAHEKMSIKFDVDDPKRAVLIAGNDDWPMPIPIVEKNGKWRFDVAQGKNEILARRIGSNELDTIELLRGYVDAQEEYASEKRDGAPMRQYAQKWISSPGKQDGLSWWDANGKPAGPAGDDIAKALAAGYTKKTEPYNGYYFRILTAQGPKARLGARNYIVNGMMIGGFAAVAWPAKYGSTGVQTFLVNSDGVVYQKDLGTDTTKIVAGIKTYNPDKTWTVTKDEED